MKSVSKATAFIMIAISIGISVLLGNSVSSFYSGMEQTIGTVGTGSTDIEIENFMLENSDISLMSNDNSGGLIAVNTFNVFSFTVSNLGKSRIGYELIIEIAWDDELPEFGKLFVYPYDVSDETILYEIESGVSTGAVIGVGTPDDTETVLSTGIRSGISVTADNAVLNSLYGGNENPEAVSKDYRFKMFFYEDQEIAAEPSLFHNKNIEVNVIASAGLFSDKSAWPATAKQFFRLTSVSDFVYPVIHEIPQSKTFFISQAGEVDLYAYAAASDAAEGDITNKMTVSSYPEFTPEKTGIYAVTYNVKNKFGLEAVPLTIHIVIWDFVKIVSGNYHTLALTSHGKVYSWGYNINGQLGDGTIANKQTPTIIPGLENIIDIAAGTGCSFALASDGQAYAWGQNDNSRLGDNTTEERRKPVKVAQPQDVKFVRIAARFATSGGITEQGDVYTWGYGGYGAAGTGATSDIPAPIKINVSNIVDFDLGYYNGAAVTKDGQLYTWGDNLHGQLGRGLPMAVGTHAPAIVPYFRDNNIKVASISVGLYHMAAVAEEGQLFTWGYGYEGRLGNGSISDKNTPQEILLPFTVRKSVAAFYHTGLLASDGTVYFAGQNAYGKHGTGNAANHTTFEQALNINNATDLSLALDSSFVLTGGINVYGMGYGGTGVLGTGNNNNSTSAVKWAFLPPPPNY